MQRKFMHKIREITGVFWLLLTKNQHFQLIYYAKLPKNIFSIFSPMIPYFLIDYLIIQSYLNKKHILFLFIQIQFDFDIAAIVPLLCYSEVSQLFHLCVECVISLNYVQRNVAFKIYNMRYSTKNYIWIHFAWIEMESFQIKHCSTKCGSFFNFQALINRMASKSKLK